MTLSHGILTYLAMLVAFLAIDFVWLAFIAQSFYQKHIGHLLSGSVNFTAAGVFYLLFIVGILVFATLPAFEKSSVIHAILAGALFGLIAYATYDLTNYATLKDWPFIVVITDMLWGAFIAGTVSAVGYWVLYALKP